MRPIAVSVRKDSVYILKENRADPEEEQVKFTLRHALPLRIRQQILNALAMDQNQNITPAIGTRYILACRHGIVGWDGLQDDRGQVVKCEKGSDNAVTEDSISSLRDEWILEIGMEIMERSTLNAEQVEK